MAGTVVEPCVGGSVHPARDRFCIQLYFVVVERVCADRLDATMFRLVSGRRSGGCRMGAYLLLYNMCCGNVKWGWRDWGMMEDDGGCPSAPGIPLRSRCARPRPPYAGAKGDGGDACASGGEGRQPAPSPPRAYPACSLRLHAPLSLGAKGAGGFPSPWGSRMEGMRGWHGTFVLSDIYPRQGCPVPSAPGIPLRSRFARPRPPYAEAKGDGGGHAVLAIVSG